MDKHSAQLDLKKICTGFKYKEFSARFECLVFLLLAGNAPAVFSPMTERKPTTYSNSKTDFSTI